MAPAIIFALFSLFSLGCSDFLYKLSHKWDVKPSTFMLFQNFSFLPAAFAVAFFREELIWNDFLILGFMNGFMAFLAFLFVLFSLKKTGAISVVVLGIYWDKSSSTGATLALLGGLSSIIGLEPIRNILGLNVSNPALIGLSTLTFSIILMLI